MNIGNAIKTCRTLKGISQNGLSKSLDISVSYLCLIEKNKRVPGLDVLSDIANALGVPLSVLVVLAAESNDLSCLVPGQIESIGNILEELVADAFSPQQSLEI